MAVDNEKIQMVMNLVDEVTPTLNEIKKQLHDTQNSMPNATQSSNSFDKLKNSIFNLNSVVKGFLAYKLVGYLATFSKQILQASSDMTELQNVTDQVFGNMAQSVQDFAKTTGNAMGRSVYQMKQYASEMGAVLKGFGGIDDIKIKEMAQNLATLSVDIGSFKNVNDTEAFNALRGGIVGETESLKRLGIVINDTTMKEYALKKGIKEKWETLNAATKAQLRYEAIMEKTVFMQGDAERTINSLANQVKVFSANMSNLSVTLGDKVTPATAGVLKGINEMLSGLNRWLESKSMQNITASAISQKIQLDTLVEKYKRLKTELNSSKKTTQEYKAKQSELEVTQQALIDMNPEFLKAFKEQKLNIQALNEVYQDTIASIYEMAKAQAKTQYLDQPTQKYSKTVKDYAAKSVDSEIKFRQEIAKATGKTPEQIKNITTEELIKKYSKDLNNALEIGVSTHQSTKFSRAVGAYAAYNNAKGNLDKAFIDLEKTTKEWAEKIEPTLDKQLGLIGKGKKINNKNTTETQSTVSDTSKSSKEKNKWQQLYDDLNKINSDLTLPAGENLLNAIRNKSLSVLENQKALLDKLKNGGVLTVSEYINKKIEVINNQIKNLSELSGAGDNNSSIKIKQLKEEIEILKKQNKFEDYLQKLKNEFDDITSQFNDKQNKSLSLQINKNYNEELKNLQNNKNKYRHDEVTYHQEEIKIIQKYVSKYKEIGNIEKLKQLKLEEFESHLKETIKTNDNNIKHSKALYSVEQAFKGYTGLATREIEQNHLKQLAEESFNTFYKEYEKTLELLSDESKTFIKGKSYEEVLRYLKENSLISVDTLNSLHYLHDVAVKNNKNILNQEKIKTQAKDINGYFNTISKSMVDLSKLLGDEGNQIVNEITQLGNNVFGLGISSARVATGDLTAIPELITNATSILSQLGSKLISIFSNKEYEEVKKDYANRKDEINKNIEALRQLNETMQDMNNTLIKNASSNTSNKNIDFNKNIFGLLNEAYAKSFDPKLLINGVAKRVFNDKHKLDNILVSIFSLGLFPLIGLKKEKVSYNKNFSDLFNTKGKNSKELQELYDNQISKLTDKDFSKFLDKKTTFDNFKWILDGTQSNLEDIKKQYLKHIENVKNYEKKYKEFTDNALLQSLEGIDIISKEDKRKQILEQMKKLYSTEEFNKLLPELTKQIDELVQKDEQIVTAFDDVRSNIVSKLSGGSDVLSSLALGLQTYFNKIRTNIGKILYDLELRQNGDFEEQFINKFKKISEELVKLRQQTGKTIKDLDPKVLNFDDLFKQLAGIKNTSNDMKNIIQELREQAKAQGLSQEIIDQMLPLEKITERVGIISNALHEAMKLALDTSSYDQFSMSIGQSVHKHFKEALIKSFVESSKFKELYSKYTDTSKYQEEVKKAQTVKEAYDIINKNLKTFENKLKAEGLGFKETNASNGEYLGGLVNRSGLDNVTKSLIEKGTKIEIQQNINNYGYLSIQDLVNGMVDLISNKLAEKKKKEV
ncbi:hypothetical protein [Caviibacter abscessus]|uniref:hypothetical protein n=1 Tax=Caviibacter abscessus TaxID=1766719 RepID=UPI000838914D|nr:hypothetical protein [Caviibacter abscessus]